MKGENMETVKESINLKDFDLSLHNYEEGLCVSITGYHGKESLVTVPGYVKDLQIKEIDIEAFKGNNKIKKITIEKGITVISFSAFEDCKELTEVELPDGLLEIDFKAFKECKKLAKIKFPESIFRIDYYDAFHNCGNLKSIFIPKNVSELDNFEGCIKLKEIIVDDENIEYSSIDGVLYNEAKTILIKYPEGKKGAKFTIPDTVNIIDWSAFGYWNNKLVTVTLPAKLSYFRAYTFSGCLKLKQVIINDENLRFKTEEGVLFDKELKALVFYPYAKGGTKYAIPDGIENINKGAFYNCGNLKEVTFPESLKYIKRGAFEKCKNIASITLPAQLKGIYEDAFFGCKKLKKVTLSRKTRVGKGAFYGAAPEFAYID